MKCPRPRWSTIRFGDVAEFRNGLNFIRSDRGAIVKVIGVGDFQNRFRTSYEALEDVQIRGTLSEGDLLKNGDLLFVRSNGNKALIGRCLIIEGLNEPVSFSGFTIRARLNTTMLEPKFVGYFFQSASAKREISIAGGGTNISNLSQSILESLEVPAPPRPEQRKICDILNTWDEALEKLDSLIAAKARRKQALMQQLLTGQRRLPGFDKSKGRTIKNRHGDYPSDWSRVKLGEVTIESSVRADTTNGGVVLSCTKHHGLVPSEEYFGKRVYAADTSDYKVARRGEFAYATNHIEEGSIGYQNICDIGLVSPIYTVFRTNDTIDDAYFYRLLKSSLMIHLYRVNTSASVDRRGSLRYGEFAEIKINLPSRSEQRAIAAVLETADRELRILRAQRQAVETQKRGLMQKLLTGKVRVSIP